MNWPLYFQCSDVRRFFGAVQQALEISKDWQLGGRKDLAGTETLNAEYVGNVFDGEELFFALCCFDDKPERVQLTMHARRWPDDRNFATDAEYMAAERLTRPIFREAAKLLQQPMSLSHPRHKKRLVGKLADKFRGFCTGATDIWNEGKLRHLHQSEYERFYQFICAAHRAGSALQSEELERALRTEGFSSELTKELTEHYVIGRRILAMGTWQWDRRSADVWNPWNVREDRKRSRTLRKKRDDEEYRRVFGTEPPGGK